MTDNYNYIFKYLEKEGIYYNRPEFLFQLQSHPEYPTVVAVTDTLSFFNITNGVIRINVNEIDLLPNRFISFHNNDKNNSEPYFIEKIENTYYCTHDVETEKITKSTLITRWTEIVLLVEKSEDKVDTLTKDKKKSLILLFASLTLYILTLFESGIYWKNSFLFLFPLLGILFSIVAFKDLFGIKSEILDNFCNITSLTSCTTIISSKKWKFFELINFSDLSFVFFITQFVTLFLFILTDNVMLLLVLQKTLILISTPVLLLSLYYQKFVEKKWCPICLAIITVLIMELVYLLLYISNNFVVSIQTTILFGFVFFTIALMWNNLKKILDLNKNLKEFQLKGNRFIRNYDIFKNNLLASSKTNFTNIRSGNILLGNFNALLKITIVSSPFCKHCSKTHAIVEKIIEKYNDKVCFDIRFDFNKNEEDSSSKRVLQKLLHIYFDKGQYVFIKALHDWFENNDENILNSVVTSQLNELKINEIIDAQYNMNQENNIRYTPTIIINQYIFPKQYDKNELIYFMNDLIEDEDF